MSLKSKVLREKNTLRCRQNKKRVKNTEQWEREKTKRNSLDTQIRERKKRVYLPPLKASTVQIQVKKTSENKGKRSWGWLA